MIYGQTGDSVLSARSAMTMARGTNRPKRHKSATSDYTYPSVSGLTRAVRWARTIESYCRGCIGNRLNLLRITDGLNDLVLQKSACLPGTGLLGEASSCAGSNPSCLCRAGRLRLDDSVWLAHWHGWCTDDLIVYSGSAKHRPWYKQRAKLDRIGSDGHCHHSWDIHFRIREWLDKREPNGNDHLHPYCY